MMRSAVLFLLFRFALTPAWAQVPLVSHYDLNITLQPSQSTYSAEARMRLTNPTAQPISEVPLLLYRLVRLSKAADAAGKPLTFHQELAAMSDEPDWQVNRVLVHLSAPLPPQASTEIVVNYAGSIWGYREVMRYVRDQIDEDYALLRAETMAYPMVAEASSQGWISAQREPFTYRVRTTVPAGWVVACGDSRHSMTMKGEQAVFECESDRPREHLEIAAAKFRVIEDTAAGLRIYALPQDVQGGRRVLGELQRARAYFGAYFRRPPDGGYTVIEIPEGWGSQASAGYCIQTPDAFRDPAQIRQLYHELAHGWNARTVGMVQRTRYFDEAFANYLAVLALREFSGPEAFAAEMDRLRSTFASQVKREPRYASLPISKWGELELGGGSYTKGAWSLYVLNELLGDEAFRKAMADFVNNYSSTPADFSAFQKSLEHSTGRSLKAFFDRWIYGIESSDDLLKEKPLAEMVAAVK